MALLWSGRILLTLMALFLLFDAVLHVVKPAPVIDAFARLDFPITFSLPLGVVELVGVVLLLVPRTNVLGAILLTGYLGGAAATQLRAGAGGATAFPIVIGALVWCALVLIDKRLWAIVFSA